MKVPIGCCLRNCSPHSARSRRCFQRSRSAEVASCRSCLARSTSSREERGSRAGADPSPTPSLPPRCGKGSEIVILWRFALVCAKTRSDPGRPGGFPDIPFVTIALLHVLKLVRDCPLRCRESLCEEPNGRHRRSSFLIGVCCFQSPHPECLKPFPPNCYNTPR